MPSSQGEVTLETFGIVRVEGRPMVRMGFHHVISSPGPPINLPQSALPKNVKSFKQIGIRLVFLLISSQTLKVEKI
jgi:hypothetical protein